MRIMASPMGATSLTVISDEDLFAMIAATDDVAVAAFDVYARSSWRPSLSLDIESMPRAKRSSSKGLTSRRVLRLQVHDEEIGACINGQLEFGSPRRVAEKSRPTKLISAGKFGVLHAFFTRRSFNVRCIATLPKFC